MKRAPFLAFAGAALAACPAAAQAPAAPARCDSPEHRQFDFWIGEWDVFRTADGRHVALSLIESLYRGCAIRENWMPLDGGGGGSLNSYDPGMRQWRQLWVDSANGWGAFDGELDGNAMVLTGPWRRVNGPGTEALVRIAWIPQEDGSVRQRGEISSDDGSSWSAFFDLTYRRRPGRPAGAAP